MAKFSPVPGTADIFPEESLRYRALEDAARSVFSRYGYGELRTPIFEYAEVFQRGLGDETEVVQKEMYTFEDRGGRKLSLRPEGTAGVMRALLNTDVLNGVEQRVYYMGPMFRGERPAAGRRRQFHQIGVENVGRISPELDAESIAMLMHFLEEVGLGDAELRINTRGIAADRGGAGNMLRNYFASHLDAMCDDCKVRFQHNLWRILDCKQECCREIVQGIPDYLSAFTAESRAYFDKVLALLDVLGVKYVRDPFLVRGLDYYVHTVFELTHKGLGAQSAVAGGGRYELFLPGENKPVVGVGFAAGMERLLMAQDALNHVMKASAPTPVFLVSLGEDALKENFRLAGTLRRAGIPVALEVEAKSMKSQMRSANRLGSRYALLRGEEELRGASAVLKDMSDGSQRTIAAADLDAELEKLFK